MAFIEARNLPSHVGIIMDGNGRWAQLRGEARVEGHREGSRAVRRIVRAARRLGLKALTLYAFSEQNWDRPEEEVETLMILLRDFLLSERDEIQESIGQVVEARTRASPSPSGSVSPRKYATFMPLM
jgi:undecaprenyl diphosphate synthase